MSDQQAIPIVCVLEAIPEADLPRHDEAAKTIFAQVIERRELDDGYIFELPIDLLVTAAEFVSWERLCCQFFEFTLKVPPAAKSFELRFAGPPEVKEAFLHELANLTG